MTAGGTQPALCAAAPQPAAPAALRRRELAQAGALGLVGLAVFFFHLGSYGLWEPDEARYAEIAREMITGGGFIVPHLNYVPYIEKPPLLYWFTSLAFHLLGTSEFAARLTPALSATAGVIATWWFARKVFDHRRAMLAAAILITSPLYASMAQVLTTDMLLTAFISAAFFSFFLQWREGGRWWIVLYVSMALAVLTKGPEGIILPGLAAALFLWRRHEIRGAISRFHIWPGMLMLLAISLPWFAIVASRLPGFVDFYIVGEHFRRAFVANYSHDQPFYFFVPVIIVGMLPWSVCFPLITSGTREAARGWCATAAVVVLLLFSIATAKLIPYILPAVPMIALLLADSICCAIETRTRAGVVSLLGPAVCAGGIAAIAVAALAPLFHNRDLDLLAHVVMLTGVIVLIGGAIAWAAFTRARFEAGLTIVALAAASALLASTYGRIDVEALHCWAPMGRELAARAPSAILIDYHRYPQAIPYYTRKRVLLAGPFLSELTFGAEHSPDRERYFLTTDADLLARWRQEKAVLIIDKSEFRRLAPRLGQVRVIAEQGHKMAVANFREPG